jgi:hypothetical protein
LRPDKQLAFHTQVLSEAYDDPSLVFMSD